VSHFYKSDVQCTGRPDTGTGNSTIATARFLISEKICGKALRKRIQGDDLSSLEFDYESAIKRMEYLIDMYPANKQKLLLSRHSDSFLKRWVNSDGIYGASCRSIVSLTMLRPNPNEKPKTYIDKLRNFQTAVYTCARRGGNEKLLSTFFEDACVYYGCYFLKRRGKKIKVRIRRDLLASPEELGGYGIYYYGESRPVRLNRIYRKNVEGKRVRGYYRGLREGITVMSESIKRELGVTISKRASFRVYKNEASAMLKSVRCKLLLDKYRLDFEKQDLRYPSGRINWYKYKFSVEEVLLEVEAEMHRHFPFRKDENYSEDMMSAHLLEGKRIPGGGYLKQIYGGLLYEQWKLSTEVEKEQILALIVQKSKFVAQFWEIAREWKVTDFMKRQWLLEGWQPLGNTNLISPFLMVFFNSVFRYVVLTQAGSVTTRKELIILRTLVTSVLIRAMQRKFIHLNNL
jgi:hypothetical protein